MSVQPRIPSLKSQDRKFMQEAIKIAKESRRLGDYAIGAVIAKNGRMIARAGNRIKTEMDPTSHTEIVAIRMACRDLGSRYLKGCTLFSTHALCPMCLTACVWSKIDRIVYGVSQQDIEEYGAKHGNERYKWRSAGIEPLEMYQYMKSAHPRLKVNQLMREECKKLFHNRV